MVDIKRVIDSTLNTTVRKYYESLTENLNKKDIRYLVGHINILKAALEDNLYIPTLISQTLRENFSHARKTDFGHVLELVAVAVAAELYKGYKPDHNLMPGVDLIFDRDGVRNVMQIKTSKNGTNSSTQKNMVRELKDAEKMIIEHDKNFSGRIRKIHGICQGKPIKRRKSNKSPVEKMVGWDLWNQVGDSDTFRLLVLALKDFDVSQYEKELKEELRQVEESLISEAQFHFGCDEDHDNVNVERFIIFAKMSEEEAIRDEESFFSY